MHPKDSKGSEHTDQFGGHPARCLSARQGHFFSVFAARPNHSWMVRADRALHLKSSATPHR